MSEQLQCCVGTTATTSGARAIAKALLISLGVHAALVALLWQGISSLRQPSLPRDVRIELLPAARPTTALASVPAPSAPKLEHIEPKIMGSAVRPVRAHAAIEQTAAPVPAIAQSDAKPSSSTAEAEMPSQAGAKQSQQGELAIDLRVLDWLSQYRAYPFAARRARIEGVVQLRVTLMPDGRLVGARVERSSGHPLLDQAALELLAHAAPLPSAFGSARTEQIELQLPIVYRMRTSST
jgi:periplasmic protein TonB